MGTSHWGRDGTTETKRVGLWGGQFVNPDWYVLNRFEDVSICLTRFNADQTSSINRIKKMYIYTCKPVMPDLLAYTTLY